MSLSIFDNIPEAPSESKSKRPNFVRNYLEKKSGYFVVQIGEEFRYYKILIEPHEESCPIMLFKKTPPFIREGLVIYEKKVYLVTMPDLLRGVIRKSREIKAEAKTKHGKLRSTDGSNSSSSENILISTNGETVQGGIESAISEDAELQLQQQADVYLQEQIGSLLNPFNSEEGEWEIESIEEPGPNNASSTVQDSHGTP